MQEHTETEVLIKEINAKINQPVYVAEVNVFKLHFPQFKEKASCIYFILHLHQATYKDHKKLKTHKTPPLISPLQIFTHL